MTSLCYCIPSQAQNCNIDKANTEEAMRVWCVQAVRRKRLLSLRKALNGSLPTLPVFVNAFGGLVPQIQEIQTIPALSGATVPNVTVQDFTDLQNATREQKTKPALQAISDTVREVYFSLLGYKCKTRNLGLKLHSLDQHPKIVDLACCYFPCRKESGLGCVRD
jgi:hypothetical protein